MDTRFTAHLEREIWQQIYREVSQGSFSSPRNLRIVELENYHYVLPPYMRFTNFTARKMSIDYIKHETMWFLRGDPYDLSICENATMWRNIIVRGRLNSNYGLAIWRQGGFDWVIEELLRDPDSRRACISILNESHMRSDTKDVPCTAYINFRIRKNHLNMSVHMRSQDAIFGMTNDAPAFSFIHEMVFETLKENGQFEGLEMGDYHHTADSFHVYERHFEMLEQLTAADAQFERVTAPKIKNAMEVRYLRTCPWTDPNYQLKSEEAAGYEFSRWVRDAKPCLIKK